MTSEEAIALGLDMFYDGKSPKEIKRQFGLKGFSERECENLFRMLEERERILDNAKQKAVREHLNDLRQKKMNEALKQLEEKRLKEIQDDYVRDR